MTIRCVYLVLLPGSLHQSIKILSFHGVKQGHGCCERFCAFGVFIFKITEAGLNCSFPLCCCHLRWRNLNWVLCTIAKLHDIKCFYAEFVSFDKYFFLIAKQRTEYYVWCCSVRILNVNLNSNLNMNELFCKSWKLGQEHENNLYSVCNKTGSFFRSMNCLEL